ncbi:MAG: ABC transporter permease, partial [candidate division Zixibacteria bacterium]|nr:ABC transporter permease [candidate division Zixibacteria bacterium]
MFRSYITIAMRHLARHKLFAAINVLSLAVSLALCLIMIGHISYEFSFEDCHDNNSRIYRVVGDYRADDGVDRSAQVMAPLGPAMVANLPEVEQAAVFRHVDSVKVGIDRERVQAGNLICANPDLLKVFTLPLLQGNPERALIEPGAVLITENAARRLFAGLNPVGKSISFGELFEGRVVGVLADIPSNTQLQCDFVASLASLNEDITSWDRFGQDYVYVMLKDGADPARVLPTATALLRQNFDPETAGRFTLHLQPLGEIYFGGYRSGELSPRGETEYMYVWSFISVFILILAVTNFVNLSTAKASDRMREVGMRKVLGAFRGQLIRQHLGEALLITVVATIISLVLYEIFKNAVADYMPREMLADFYRNSRMMLATGGLVLLVALLAGFYPALYLSRFQPLTILRASKGAKSTRSRLRKTLVVVQFTIAIMFI